MTDSLDSLDRATATVATATARTVDLADTLAAAMLAGPLSPDGAADVRAAAQSLDRAARGVESAAATVELVCLALLVIVAVGVAGDILLNAGPRLRG